MEYTFESPISAQGHQALNLPSGELPFTFRLSSVYPGGPTWNPWVARLTCFLSLSLSRRLLVSFSLLPSLSLSTPKHEALSQDQMQIKNTWTSLRSFQTMHSKEHFIWNEMCMLYMQKSPRENGHSGDFLTNDSTSDDPSVFLPGPAFWALPPFTLPFTFHFSSGTATFEHMHFVLPFTLPFLFRCSSGTMCFQGCCVLDLWIVGPDFWSSYLHFLDEVFFSAVIYIYIYIRRPCLQGPLGWEAKGFKSEVNVISFIHCCHISRILPAFHEKMLFDGQQISQLVFDGLQVGKLVI